MSGANTGLGVFQAVKEKNDEGASPLRLWPGTRPKYLGIGLDLIKMISIQG